MYDVKLFANAKSRRPLANFAGKALNIGIARNYALDYLRVDCDDHREVRVYLDGRRVCAFRRDGAEIVQVR